MTLRVPSAFAALTRASMPPTASADVAVAASLPPPLLDPPPLDPQAVRVSPAVTTATAVRRMVRRTCPPVVVPSCPRAPLTGEPGGSAIVADRACRGVVLIHERVLTVRSTTGEDRLAGTVLEEGAHAGPLVLGAEHLREQPALQRQALVDRQLEPFVDRPLGGGEGERRPGGELLRHRHRGAVDLVVGDDGVGHADLQRFLRAHVAAGEDHVLGLRRADEAGEPLRAAGPRDDAEED